MWGNDFREKFPAMKALRFAIGAGRSISLHQFWFDTPVRQPRGSRRMADATGLKVWPTALPLLMHLQGRLAAPLADTRPIRILELGSGCGLLGIGLAATCNAEVVLTDPALPVAFADDEPLGNTLEWLAMNVELNRDAVGSRASVEKLAWGDSDDMEALRRNHPAGFDLVVGSDLLYNPDSYGALIETAQRFARREVIFGFPTRFGSEQQRFFEAVASAGQLEVAETLSLPPVSERDETSAMARPISAAHLRPRAVSGTDLRGDVRGEKGDLKTVALPAWGPYPD